MNRLKCFSILVVSIIMMVSCTNILYENNPHLSNIQDIRSGTLLINEIDGEISEKSIEQLTDKLIDGLSKMGFKSITYIETARRNINLPESLPFNPDPSLLKSLNESTEFDLLINVKATSFQDESGGIAFGEQDLENSASIEISLYDIRLQKRVYYYETIASEIWPMNDEMEEKPSRFSFTRSSENLLNNALKQSLKELKKN